MRHGRVWKILRRAVEAEHVAVKRERRIQNLDGVDGVLIALPDGLLVASHIPPSMNADTWPANVVSPRARCTLAATTALLVSSSTCQYKTRLFAK